jgi:hypothetical protein
MNAMERGIEFPDQVVKRNLQRRPPPYQHIILAGTKRSLRHKADRLTQAPPHTVSLDGVADLPRHGEADPAGPFIAARPRLQDKAARRRPRAFGGSLKVRPAFQPLHEIDFGT